MRRWHVVWLVAQREIRERVRGRAYTLSTAFIVLVSAGLVLGAQLLPDMFESAPRQLGIVEGADESVVAALPAAAGESGIELELERVPSRAEGDRLLEEGEVDALLTPPATLVFTSSVDQLLSSVVGRAAYLAELPDRLEELGLTAEQVRQLTEQPQIPVDVVDPEETRDPAGLGASFGAAQLSTIVLYIALAFYGTWVLTGVIEERTSRVVEVLLGTIRPATLLAGKVLGILALAVLQILAGGAAMVLALLVTGFELPSVGPEIVVVGIASFVLGLLLYSFAYAAIGATSARQADSSSAAAPITMGLIVPYMIAIMVVPEAPDGVLAVALSLIPLTAPLVMPSRVALGDPAAWELALAAALMLPAIAGMIWLGGRIYAGGVLSGGSGLRAAFRASRETAGDA